MGKRDQSSNAPLPRPHVFNRPSESKPNIPNDKQEGKKGKPHGLGSKLFSYHRAYGLKTVFLRLVSEFSQKKSVGFLGDFLKTYDYALLSKRLRRKRRDPCFLQRF